MRPIRHVLLIVAVAAFSAAPAGAQGSRPAMVDSARALIDDFNERQSIRLLRRALNPALGAPDSLWARGVQLLGQTLLQTDQQEEAVSWLRWAVRLSPSLQADSVNFTPALVNALHEARAYVAASRTEPRVSIRFEWSMATTPEGFGDLRVARDGNAAIPMQISANGEFLDEGRPRRLSPGSYRIAARTAGQSDAELTTEVLPGVTTLVTVNFVNAASLVTAERTNVAPGGQVTESPSAPPVAKPNTPKRRSKLLPIIGGVAVAGIVGALAMPKSGPDPVRTGGIVLRLP